MKHKNQLPKLIGKKCALCEKKLWKKENEDGSFNSNYVEMGDEIFCCDCYYNEIKEE